MAPARTHPDWQSVLAHFDLGAIRTLRPGGGTAAPKVQVETDRGRFLVRARRPQSSEDDVVAFDHSVMQALARAGLPTVAPLPCREASSGYQVRTTWVRDGDVAYEAFPFVGGLEGFTPGNLDQLQSAARSLALLHRATADLRPEGSKPWVREHEVGAMRETLRRSLTDSWQPGDGHGRARAMLAAASALQQQLTERLARALPHVIVHADYTPANVMFRGDAVGGIFDFDWVSYQPRVVDVGEALQFFAFRRQSPIDPDSIWSLVQAWEPDTDGARCFLQAYQEVWPLTRPEADALPLFMRETWLGVRIRAMRKVDPSARLRILTDGALPPLRWLEQHVADVCLLVKTTRPSPSESRAQGQHVTPPGLAPTPQPSA